MSKRYLVSSSRLKIHPSSFNIADACSALRGNSRTRRSQASTCSSRRAIFNDSGHKPCIHAVADLVMLENLGKKRVCRCK